MAPPRPSRFSGPERPSGEIHADSSLESIADNTTNSLWLSRPTEIYWTKALEGLGASASVVVCTLGQLLVSTDRVRGKHKPAPRAHHD